MRQYSAWQSVESDSMGLSNLEAGYEQMSAEKTMIDMQIEMLNAIDKNGDQRLYVQCQAKGPTTGSE